MPIWCYRDKKNHPDINPDQFMKMATLYVGAAGGLFWTGTTSTCLVDRSDHVCLEFEEPLLHLAAGLRRRDDVPQFDDLALATLHVSDVENVSELERGDAFEALLQMWLNPRIYMGCR